MSTAPPAPARPSARAWSIWGLGAAFFGYAFFQRVAPSVIVDDLMRDFALGGAILGNLSAFYFYAYASMQIPVGVLVDRLGPRRLLTVAACVAAAGAYLFATAESLTLAYAGRFLVGIGCAIPFISTLSLVAVWFPHRYLAMMAGLTMGMGTLGGLLAQAPLAALVEAFAWRPTLLAAAAVPPVLALAIFLVVRDRPPGAGRGTPGAGGHDEGPRLGLLDGLRQVTRRRQTWAVALYGGLMAGPLLAFGGLWGVPWLMQVRGVERPLAALIISAMLMGWSVGAPLFGWLSDRLGRRKPAMAGGAALALITMLAILYIRDLPLPVLGALLFINGLFSGAMTNCFAAIREHNPGPAVGVAFAMVNTANVASAALLQPFIGYLLDLNWDGTQAAGARHYDLAAYDTALAIFPLSFALALGAALMVRETFCRPVELA